MEPERPTEARDYDTLDNDLHCHDPWPFYAWLREEAPLYWDQHNEIWSVSRYDDVVAISKDPETFTSTEGNRPNLPPDPSMINQDGRQHVLQRRLVSSGFTPRHIKRITDQIREIAIDMIADVQAKGECDLVVDLAAPLPRRLVLDMLGVPREDEEQIQAWIDTFVFAGGGPQYVTDEVNDAFFALAEYHENLVAKRRENPGDDLISTWLTAEIDGQKLDDDQLLFEHTLLLVGGTETTRNAISGGIDQLLHHPDQWRDVQTNRDILPNAIEEMIRWVSPFVNMVRTATKNVEMHGRIVYEGDQISLLYPAANRDPRHFDNPETFDVRRNFRSPSLAFGHGPHFCLGANLARMEIKILLEEIFARLPDLGLKPGATPEWRPSSFIRGIKTMPVVFTATQPERAGAA